MGKEKPGFMTPKAIANRIKAKGLQKLRWYCQMCQKQCRDENGFKCHLSSEAHHRQIMLYNENPHRFMDEYSTEFKTGYLLCLRHRFGTKRVSANKVYQEYISDRNHIHMNGTRWMSLSGFVQYLGKTGICHVDQTEKGWFIQYIDRDPETLRRQQELEKKRKLDVDDRERQLIYLEKQIEKAKEKDGEAKASYTELKKDEDQVIKISFKKMKTDDGDRKISAQNEDDEENDEDESSKVLEFEANEPGESKSADEEEDEDDEEEDKKDKEVKPSTSSAAQAKDENLGKAFTMKVSNMFKKPTLPSSAASTISTSKKSDVTKISALDKVRIENEQKREKMNRKDYWLHANIIVKIVTKKLGEKFQNKKAVVMSVKDKYVGIIKLLDSDTVLKVDQEHVETVIPAIGKRVFIVNGAYRGEEATLEAINEKDFSAKLVIAAGPLKGRTIDNVQYEDFSKLSDTPLQ